MAPLGLASPGASIATSVKAVLGPTNTGKTHSALERMLQHPTGMIGLPLRLLAREVYDRLTAKVGESAVALVTGEEKRVPARPRYWVCTVEAMPERDVDFLAVDEVQLAGHRERGHVFTDRLLHARGREETWFLGAGTMRPLVERLVPTAQVESRPRLSTLSGVGPLPLSALPPRTAVVAFTAARVYELAERLRGKRGGAAVVLGALSPRARNAQVALYQSGEVDYMVATDAIGMGLNMDVDCVAFADLRKFDGRQSRELEDAELAQIAGRAGRYTNDGRFATLEPLPPLSPAVTRAIERHRFPPQERIYWRNRALEMRSVEALVMSLKKRPFAACLDLVDDAEDFRALVRLAQDPDVMARARGAERVELLWQVCQIPDFRQLQLDDHFQLLRAVFLQLTSSRARLEPDWVRDHVDRLDDVQGDIDTLLARMAFIRTWTFISTRAAWLGDAAGWQARTRAIEDRLSDALHEQLVQRFVDKQRGRRGRARAERDRRDPVSAGRSMAEQLRDKILGGALAAAEPAGDATDAADHGWVDELIDAPFERFSFDEEGRLFADGRLLARMSRGVDLLHPEVTIASDELGAGARLRLQRRLLAWTRDLVAQTLAPLAPPEGARLTAAGRGLLYGLESHLGTVRVESVRAQLETLAPADRTALRALGVRLGRRLVYAAPLLAPEALRARVALCAASLRRMARLDPPRADTRSLSPAAEVPDEIYGAIGYPIFGPRAIRADVAEEAIERALRGDHNGALAARIGCPQIELPAIRAALLDGVFERRRLRAPRRA